jgi:hypothetical protein
MKCVFWYPLQLFFIVPTTYFEAFLNLPWIRRDITINQHSETNVLHLLFILLRIKGPYMFQALLDHPQEALHKRHLVYCIRVMSVGCIRIGVELVSTTPISVCVAPPEDEQVMLETCRGPWFLINWIKSAIHWFLYTDIVWCTVNKTFKLW